MINGNDNCTRIYALELLNTGIQRAILAGGKGVIIAFPLKLTQSAKSLLKV